MRAIARKEKEDRDGDEEEARDSLVTKILQIKKPQTIDGFKVLVKHRQSVTAVVLSDDDLKGFSTSKDGTAGDVCECRRR
ncbi:hypothetical protein V6N13_123506 [Hibiscus sabdariffa]|uniref:Uncharacterized protein n=1 Tax=Hibiscus sabdariffa TaxID=183260 RepID=A0ABR2QTP9_9ROSI